MPKQLRLQFDPDQKHQLDAVGSVVRLFEGLPHQAGAFALGQEVVPNLPIFESLSESWLAENLRVVQQQNDLPTDLLAELDVDEGLELEGVSNASWRCPSFTVEMETGTGKTYAYVRTIYELRKQYGFSKFIIVVPSIAIYEGVIKNFQITRDHFSALYGNERVNVIEYEGSKLSQLRAFAASTFVEVLVITLDSFNKASNVIYKPSEKLPGEHLPYQYLQAVRPILILDEPQNMGSEKAKAALRTLHPLFTLRYSATHRETPNLVYRLTPFDAYRLNLVKKIQVFGVTERENVNQPFLGLVQINRGSSITAQVRTYVEQGGKVSEEVVTLKHGEDLYEKTHRAEHRGGYRVSEINAADGFVEFENGLRLSLTETLGPNRPEVFRAQIRQTIEQHIAMQERLRKRGIKVLSLFFIDKVANYRWYDDEGHPRQGKLAEWFEEAYQKVSQKSIYAGLLPYSVEQLHDGYFSADRKKGQVVALKDTSGTTKADDETYHLIMRDKERLLSNDEPLRFIFSHSALKEGWDNPNVFQICTLREMGTERERRQTLGRGLRLPVNQDGERIFDDSVNRLTVIASESFEEYASGLQEDIERDCQVKFGRIEKIAFAKLVDDKTEKEIGQETSGIIWENLKERGYLDAVGDITNLFVPEKEGFKLELPPEFEPMRALIIDEMKRYVFKNRVVNAREHRTLKYNKRVELNGDFEALWQKINKKTRYSVEFKAEELISRAVAKIKKMETIQPVRILIDKTGVGITEAGVEGLQVLESRTEFVASHRFLPDILAYLQRETELTRSTLVEILTQSGRLKEFTVNPQAFMTETAKLIKRALHEMIVDGIKYEQIEGQVYEMRLFEEREIEEYLSRLYEVQSKGNRTPYDYVPYDSEVEREIAEKLDSSESVKFFCKLPRWFVVPTPLGDYNPDWAVVTENGGKLYLVRESKSTHDRDKRRETENRKIDCGQAHFDALGVNFKVATNIHEVLTS